VYPPDEDHAEINVPPKLVIAEGSEKPLEFEDFKKDIDTKGGYVQQLAQTVECFRAEIEQAKAQSVEEHAALERCLADEASEMSEERCVFLQYTNQYLLPDKNEEKEVENTEVYPEEHRTKEGKLQDECLLLIRQWLKDPLQRPSNLDDRQFWNLVRASSQFFLTKESRLYRRGLDSTHKLVVEKDRQMYMMKAAHDNLGHRGFYVTKTIVAECFWWPELERDGELVLQDLSHLSDEAEAAGEDTTSGDTYSFNIPSTACGHNAYVT
jgi:Integrase zinc binding domain